MANGVQNTVFQTTEVLYGPNSFTESQICTNVYTSSKGFIIYYIVLMLDDKTQSKNLP